MKKDYVKHLVKCKCILPQFRQMPDPPFHKFIVFSEIDETSNVVPSFAQCPNCGACHKVKEVGLSDILRKEDLPSILTIDEIKGNLPERLLHALGKYDLELHQWMEIKWIMENEGWGKTVVLSKEMIDGELTGKYIQILGQELWRINNFTREDTVATK